MDKEERYSRQIGTYGMETMKKLSEFKIFIYGMRGLGVELAKNLILMGIKEVTICDENLVKINDLSSNYILTENDVGKVCRDKACLSDLKKLNNFVDVNICEISDLTLLCKKVKKYDIVIINMYIPFQCCGIFCIFSKYSTTIKITVLIILKIFAEIIIMVLFMLEY